MITRPLLAYKLKNNEIDKLQFPLLATPKLDGIRCLIINGVAVSRTFKQIPNHHVRETLICLLPNGMDGEIMVPGVSFHEISGAIRRFDGEPAFQYHVFDYVSGSLDTPYEERIDKLNDWFINVANEEAKMIVKLVLPELICDRKQLDTYEQKVLNVGYEGVMLRDLTSKYKCGRSTFNERILLAIKKFEDAEATIVGFTERMHNNNCQEDDNFGLAKRSSHAENMVPMNTLGALVVRDMKTGVEFNIGTGFDDTLRQEIWNCRDKYIDQIVRYKYQKVGTDVAPRCPVFQGIRNKEDM